MNDGGLVAGLRLSERCTMGQPKGMSYRELVVALDDVPGDDAVGAGPAVVRPLRRGKSVGRPAQRMPVGVQHGVLLLEAEPRMQIARLQKSGSNR